MSRSRAHRRKHHHQQSGVPVQRPGGGQQAGKAGPQLAPVPIDRPNLPMIIRLDANDRPVTPSVPPEFLAELRRQWTRFVIAATLVMFMAGLAVGGWMLYGRAKRGQERAEGQLSDTQRTLTTTAQERDRNLTRAEQAETKVTDLERARVELDGKLTVTRQALEQERTESERARQDLNTQRTETTRVHQELETQKSNTELMRQDLESKLAAKDQSIAAIQGSLTEAQQARAAAETRAAGVEAELNLAKAQAGRLAEDVAGYRKDLESAREAERLTAQRLEAAWASSQAGRGAPTPGEYVAPAGRSGTVSSVDAAAQPSDGGPAAVVLMPPGGAAALPDATATQITNVALTAAGPPRLPRPSPEAVAAVSPPANAPAAAFLVTGEDQLVNGDPAIGVELIQQAITKEPDNSRADYLKSLGWGLLKAGRTQEARPVLEQAIAGFPDWSTAPPDANPDHWTAAFLLGKVNEREYARRWAGDAHFGSRLECLPWFYIGQQREMAGQRQDALEAYRVSVELGSRPNAYPIWRWAGQRIAAMEQAEAQTRPAQ